MLAVCVSRMYLGGHSLDQVVQGTFLGISLSVLYVHGGLKKFIGELLIRQSRRSYQYWLGGILVIMHGLYAWAYMANNRKAQEHKKAAKIWVKNYNSKCGKDIDEHYLNSVMLFLNAVLVNILTGLCFGFKNILKVKEAHSYLKGRWEINMSNYNKIVGYIIFIMIQAGLFSIGFIVFSPIPLLFGKDTVVNFIYFNLSCVISSYVFSAWSLPVLLRAGVLAVEEGGKEEWEWSINLSLSLYEEIRWYRSFNWECFLQASIKISVLYLLNELIESCFFATGHLVEVFFQLPSSLFYEANTSITKPFLRGEA